MFIMTPGLRSARDKALTYFKEVLEERDESFDKLYKAVNALAEQVRRINSEDKDTPTEAGYSFNLHCVIGGQLGNDKEHKLYILYPQANWVEVDQSTPYYVIGELSCGKLLLDRVLTYESNIEIALKVGFLAFDATRVAATDVNFPFDVVLYRAGTYKIASHRYEADKFRTVDKWWQRSLAKSGQELPGGWVRTSYGSAQPYK